MRAHGSSSLHYPQVLGPRTRGVAVIVIELPYASCTKQLVVLLSISEISPIVGKEGDQCPQPTG